MAKRQPKAPPFTRGTIHFIKDEYAAQYRVWQDNWNGQFDLMAYEEFDKLQAIANQFNAIELIDHTFDD